jgi:hypothetical protein
VRAELLIIASLLFAAVARPAQRSTATPTANSSAREAPPGVKVAFSEEQNIPQLAAQVVFGPIDSTPDGAVFLQTSQSPNLQAATLWSIAKVDDTSAVISFAPEKAPDLHDPQLRTYFATDSLVVELINATPDDAMSSSKQVIVVPRTGERAERTVRSGARHDYIATFDRQGNCKRAAQLDVPFKPQRLAVFGSGQILLVGYDTENKTKFAFINDDGSMQRLLDTDKPMEGWQKMIEGMGLSNRGPAEDWAGAPPPLGLVQIVPFRDGILFVSPGLTWILEISPSGSFRRIPIHVPEGLVIDHFIPSDKMWYVSFRKYGADTNESLETTLYEISPVDGRLVERFDTSPLPVSGIASAHDGEFRAIESWQTGLKLFRGTPQR